MNIFQLNKTKKKKKINKKNEYKLLYQHYYYDKKSDYRESGIKNSSVSEIVKYENENYYEVQPL